MILSFLFLPGSGNASILKRIWILVLTAYLEKHSEALVCATLFSVLMLSL